MTVTIEQITSDRMDSNTYLIEEEGHVVIVDGCAGQAVLDRIESKGWTADLLLLTHEHFDHIWYLELLRQRLDIPVVACALTSQRVQDVKANLSNISDVLYYFKTGILREGKSESFTCRAADILFEDELLLPWREHRFLFLRLPGHSPGSTIIVMDPEDGGAMEKESAAAAMLESGRADGAENGLMDGAKCGIGSGEIRAAAVFSGDYLIQGEEEITRLKDGSTEDYEAIARPVLEGICAGTVIYPGHGDVYEKERS